MRSPLRSLVAFIAVQVVAWTAYDILKDGSFDPWASGVSSALSIAVNLFLTFILRPPGASDIWPDMVKTLAWASVIVVAPLLIVFALARLNPVRERYIEYIIVLVPAALAFVRRFRNGDRRHISG